MPFPTCFPDAATLPHKDKFCQHKDSFEVVMLAPVGNWTAIK